jgi:hypothetical protein
LAQPKSSVQHFNIRTYRRPATPEAQKHHPQDKKSPPRELFAKALGYWGITFNNDDSSQHSYPDYSTTLIATSTRHAPLK